MGSSNSHLQQPLLDHHQLPPIMHEPSTYQPQYPDMNQIFKGIPKMIQVADDMHRMTNYIQDLRNLMYAISMFTAGAILLFLAYHFWHNRKGTKRRRRAAPNNNVCLLSYKKQRGDESEQSSLSISRPSNYRHYQSARPVDNWTQKIEMDRMLDSTSTRHTNMTHGTPGALHGTGSHLMLNNKLALGNSPEHQQHQQVQQNHYQQQQRHPSPMHEAGGISGHSNQISPCPTPTSSGHPTGPNILHHPQPNGQLKRLDPVKLVVDEMPYVDNEQEN